MEDEDETGEGDSEYERNESGLGNDDKCRLNRLLQNNGVFQFQRASVRPSQRRLLIRTRDSNQGRPSALIVLVRVTSLRWKPYRQLFTHELQL